MRKHILYPLTAFVIIFLLHATYSVWKASVIAQQWVQIENVSLLSLYFTHQEFLLGFAYALAGAFALYALLKFLANRKSGAVGVMGGLTLTGLLYISGCFLVGCCGSPMLAVYVGLFGSSFLGFTKPLIATMTTLSVVIGYLWMEKKCKVCGADSQQCSREPTHPPSP